MLGWRDNHVEINRRIKFRGAIPVIAFMIASMMILAPLAAFAENTGSDNGDNGELLEEEVIVTEEDEENGEEDEEGEESGDGDGDGDSDGEEDTEREGKVESEQNTTSTTGSITIEKVVRDADGNMLDPQPNVNFQVKIRQDDGDYDVNHTVNPTGASKSVTGLPYGTYTVTEAEHADYSFENISNESFSIPDDDGVNITVTNKLERDESTTTPEVPIGSIELTKIVLDADGNELDEQPDVNFQVNIRQNDGDYDVTHTVNPSGASKVVAGLPYGTYTATELVADGYEFVEMTGGANTSDDPDAGLTFTLNEGAREIAITIINRQLASDSEDPAEPDDPEPDDPTDPDDPPSVPSQPVIPSPQLPVVPPQQPGAPPVDDDIAVDQGSEPDETIEVTAEEPASEPDDPEEPQVDPDDPEETTVDPEEYETDPDEPEELVVDPEEPLGGPDVPETSGGNYALFTIFGMLLLVGGIIMRKVAEEL